MWTVYAFSFGAWHVDATGFATRADAAKYVRQCKFWDGFRRRVQEVK